MLLNRGRNALGTSSGPPTPPAGFAFVTDSNGNYLVDNNGNYIITETA